MASWCRNEAHFSAMDLLIDKLLGRARGFIFHSHKLTGYTNSSPTFILFPTPLHPPSHPHPLTPSRPHALTSSHPHILTPSLPDSLTPSLPQPLTPSPPTPSILSPTLTQIVSVSLLFHTSTLVHGVFRRGTRSPVREAEHANTDTYSVAPGTPTNLPS